VVVADSIQVVRLKRVGAIIVGKTNTPEFGHTLVTKNRMFGVTRNPCGLERIPAWCLWPREPMRAGSVRLPVAHCGCFGYRPPLGYIPCGGFPGPRDLLTMNPISAPGPFAAR